MSTRGKRNQDEDLVNEESPKRLRGGGYGAEDGEDLFDDDAYEEMMMEDQDGPPPPDDNNNAGDEDVAFGDLTEAHRARWARPAVPASVWKTHENDLNLQWLDIDMIVSVPFTFIIYHSSALVVMALTQYTA